MDVDDLYREETFTDRRIGTIRQLTPLKRDGSTDAGRPVRYVGETQILTSGGMLPLHFDIEATSISEAASKFGAAAQVAFEETVKQLQALRREAASQVVIPDAGTTSSILGPGGLPPGGPGGKIRLL